MSEMLGAPVVVFGDEQVVAALAMESGVQVETDFEVLLTTLANDTSALGFVIWADAVSVEDIPRLVDAVIASGRPCIEVRAERWDGRTPSPLSAACNGVISGFGVSGVRAACALLRPAD